MLKILVKQEAEKDLAKIFEFTFDNWGLKQAEKYQDELFYGMKQIAQQENIGKVYPFSTKQYRKFHINRHLTFYKVEGENCIFIRILHVSIEINTHLM